MDEPVEYAWNKDLAEALTLKTRIWMRGSLRPRIVVLPAWYWTGFGSWTVFIWIFITAKQMTCPDTVRRYIIGHEVGHIFGGHVYLQYLFVFAACLLLAGEANNSVGTLILAFPLTMLVYLGFVLPSLSFEREAFADDVAVELYGAESTLSSSLWMARKASDINTRQRQARLNRLRKFLSAAESFPPPPVPPSDPPQE